MSRLATATYIAVLRTPHDDTRNSSEHHEKAGIRYIVDDVAAALDFHVNHLGFAVELHPGPGFAVLGRAPLRLMLSVPSGKNPAGVPLHANVITGAGRKQPLLERSPGEPGGAL
ncbi:hypothetical protein [Paeniglutamicibacter sp.]|uniref:hypothetical protein n=1 Tax=Paeniglutamicibacter sp. TaxID=1934391 RepID=UPI0039893E72